MEKLASSRLSRACLAELIGTFAFVFVGAGAVCVGHWRWELGLVGVAAAHGLILAVMVGATAHISGGHLNPALTVALLAGMRIGKRRALAYIGSQLTGAALGGALLGILLATGRDVNDLGDVLSYSAQQVHLGTPSYAPTVLSPIAAASVEALLTFLLVFVAYATQVDPRGQRLGGPWVGAAYAALLLVGQPFTGAAMNPARAFGPLVAGGRLTASLWTQHWVYWAGPMAGALLAAAIYESGFMLKFARRVEGPGRRQGP
jgi:aquaporin Z